jgi:opacity protein-like surface antigen
VGAGFDHRLTNDLWGATDLVAVDGEVMFQYMDFGTQNNSLVDAVSNSLAGAPAGTIKIQNQITQLTLSASPKLKFNLMEGALRPWIIPFGLSINIISPPSSGVTVLNPGLMLGTGVEYRIWKNLWAGVDFRYNFTGGSFDYKAKLPDGTTVYNATNTDGLTTGGYIGLGF